MQILPQNAGSDKPGVLASVASVLGNNDVGIDRVIQKTKKNGLAD